MDIAGPRVHGAPNSAVRQDYLDQIIWMQIIALLENEKLIQ